MLGSVVNVIITIKWTQLKGVNVGLVQVCD